MKIISVKLIYFSPTRTTRKILEGVAEGVSVDRVEHLDLTPPQALDQEFSEMHEELAIIGAPVYGGRLPVEMLSRFRRLNGQDTPAVIIAVYGNRAYEDALLELRDVALERGFKPVAAGAFVGEHSFSCDTTPIAPGRPDEADLWQAREFGKKVGEKMAEMSSLDRVPPLQVPGDFPYREFRSHSGITPRIDETICSRCGACASVCPTAAIATGDAPATDGNLCCLCCACVNFCPAGARTMEDDRIREVAERLAANCRARKEPETFI